MTKQIPPEGTAIWVWVRDVRMGVGPVKCRVGIRYTDRDVKAHVLNSEEWVWLGRFTIFSELRDECVMEGIDREVEELNQLKNGYELQKTRVEELTTKWLT